MSKSYNVMILGGSGFIGQNLSRHLNDCGHRVSVFDVREPEAAVPGIDYRVGDFFDDRSLDVLTEGRDVVIHALSTINPGNSNVAYLRGYERDFVQTIRLFDRLARTGGRLLFLSSAGTIYGGYSGRPFEESDPLRPINHYGSVKLCVETAMRAFNVQQGPRFMSCRITTPSGPGQDYRKGVGFIDAVVKSVMNRQRLEIWGDGSVVRDYIYIEDVCRAMEALLHYEGGLSTFNISTGVGTSQNEILRMFEALGFPVEVDYQPTRAVDVKASIASSAKLTAATGVTCRSLEAGIRDYLAYLKMI